MWHVFFSPFHDRSVDQARVSPAPVSSWTATHVACIVGDRVGCSNVVVAPAGGTIVHHWTLLVLGNPLDAAGDMKQNRFIPSWVPFRNLAPYSGYKCYSFNCGIFIEKRTSSLLGHLIGPSGPEEEGRNSWSRQYHSQLPEYHHQNLRRKNLLWMRGWYLVHTKTVPEYIS